MSKRALVGLIPVIPPAGTWQTLYSTTRNTNNPGWTGYTIRQLITTAGYTGGPATGSKIRITACAPAGATNHMIWDHWYVGHAAAAGDAYDFDGNQVQVTLGGSASGDVAPGTTLYLSDEITFSFDKTKNLIISMHFSGTSDAGYKSSITGFTLYYKGAVSEAGTTNVASYSNLPSELEVFMKTEVFGAPPTAYNNFIARTSGLDSTHLAAYAALLDGLTTDGLFNSDGTSNYLDCLFIYATQNQTTALINLVSTAYSPAVNLGGFATFTADRGFNGSSVQIPIDISAATTHYLRNDAHASCWSLTDVDSADLVISGSAGDVQFYLDLGGIAYCRVNDGGGGKTVTDSLGFYLGTRTSSTNRNTYKNGASLGSTTASSVAIEASTVVNSPHNGGRQIACVSLGANIDTFASQLYDRLRTYMTAVGVP